MGLLKERYENAKNRGNLKLMVFGWLFDIAIVACSFMAASYFADENKPIAYFIGIGISVIFGIWVVFETIIVTRILQVRWKLRKSEDKLKAKAWMDV